RGAARYGVRANAICPRTRTAMTAEVFGEAPEGEDLLAPERVATFVAYLASPAADAINGQIFVVYGGLVALLAAPTVERTFTAESGAFSVAELDAQLTPYFAQRPADRTFAARDVAELGAATAPAGRG